MNEKDVLENLESALKKVKDQKENFGYMDRLNVDENYVVMKALEKQIPIKPIDKITYKECPICGSVDLGRYCMECGQAIKWGDEE